MAFFLNEGQLSLKMMDFLKDNLPPDSCPLLYLFSPGLSGGLSCTDGRWWQVRGAIGFIARVGLSLSSRSSED